MTRDDIIRMAREAGMAPRAAIGEYYSPLTDGVWPEDLERFATLVRDYLLSTEIHSCHADCQRFACVQTRKAVEAEREACIRDCDSVDVVGADVCAAAIRARGEH